jgi:hypothetical protein
VFGSFSQEQSLSRFRGMVWARRAEQAPKSSLGDSTIRKGTGDENAAAQDMSKAAPERTSSGSRSCLQSTSLRSETGLRSPLRALRLMAGKCTENA